MHTHYVSTVVHVLLQVFVLQEEVAPLDKDVHVQKVYKRIDHFSFSVSLSFNKSTLSLTRYSKTSVRLLSV